jgi:heme/copper-type cytochrome/quinol oxidase subunit 2
MSAAATLVIAPAVARLLAQEPPNRREFTITARDYRFNPGRIEVGVDDLVKLTVRSEDVAYSFTIDQFRVSKRIPAGGTVTFEFRADRGPGTYSYYSNMTSDPRHAAMKGDLVVKAR